MRKTVLGLPVDILSKDEVISLVENWLKVPGKQLKMIVTAYSEFFVQASEDKDFADIIRKADLVTADGRSVLGAIEYNRDRRLWIVDGRFEFIKSLWLGLKIGGKILRNELGETITGVWFFEELAKRAEEKNWKVFILGGWNDVDVRVVKKLKQLYPKLRVVSDAGEKKVGTSELENTRVVEKINKFKPDILFVAYNPVKQEKWIAKNKKSLNVGVAIGIGGTLNEFVGDLKPTPLWMQQSGLKWLWRLILEPFRWKRMINAVIVFPWMVFRERVKS